MEPRVAELLEELKARLERLYGPRLRGVRLFGSYARGEADDESDVDVLIVLDRVDAYGDEIERTSELASRLSLRYDVSVSRVFVSQAAWSSGDTTFLRNIREEARPAWRGRQPSTTWIRRPRPRRRAKCSPARRSS